MAGKPAEKAAGGTAAEEAASTPGDGSTRPDEDEQHRKFREALERKKAAGNQTHGDGKRNTGVGGANNDRKHREFRRKSG